MMAVGSSVDGGVGHSSEDELGDELLECEGDGGDKRGDGYDSMGMMTCLRGRLEVAAGITAAADVEVTAHGRATLVDIHCGGMAGQSTPYSFLTCCVNAFSSAASTWRICSR